MEQYRNIVKMYKQMFETSDVFKNEERDSYRFQRGYTRVYGFAGAFGEAFRPFLSTVVYRSTYVVAGAYIASFTIQKSIEMSQRYYYTPRNTLAFAVDSIPWQMACVIAVPSITARIASTVTTMVATPFTSVFSMLPKYTPKLIGGFVAVFILPFTIYPGDLIGHEVMDRTIRPFNPFLPLPVGYMKKHNIPRAPLVD